MTTIIGTIAIVASTVISLVSIPMFIISAVRVMMSRAGEGHRDLRSSQPEYVWIPLFTSSGLDKYTLKKRETMIYWLRRVVVGLLLVIPAAAWYPQS